MIDRALRLIGWGLNRIFDLFIYLGEIIPPPAPRGPILPHECDACGHHKSMHLERGCDVVSRMTAVGLEVECSCERVWEQAT